MNALAVALLTAFPVLLGMMVGRRFGGGRTLLWLVKLAIAWSGGVALAAYGFRAGWFRPVGLVSPLIAGLFVVLIVNFLFARLKRRSRERPPLGRTQQFSGAVLGGIIGFVLAIAGWQLALLAISLASPAPQSVAEPEQQPASKKKSSWTGLAEVAHDGFLKHLPIAGPVTEEMLATATILKTPLEVRKQFARHKQWDALADLPSYQAIATDPVLFAEIDAAAAGNLAALYRLQTHPKIIAFAQEEQLQAIIADLKASEIATELAEFQRDTAGP